MCKCFISEMDVIVDELRENGIDIDRATRYLISLIKYIMIIRMCTVVFWVSFRMKICLLCGKNTP